MDNVGRLRESSKVLLITLILNLVVAILKFVFGLLANSLSMIADAVHSSFDSVSNIIGLVALRFASKPPDRGHPYGHWKYENLATLAIAALIFITCFEIVLNAVHRFQSQITPEITTLLYFVMFICILINIVAAVYEKRKGEELNSDILVADSYHTGSDIFASISVVIGFIFIDSGYPIVDPMVALMIAALIGFSGYRIVKRSSSVLCDAIVIDPKEIEKIALEVPEVESCHKIRSRGSENEMYVDLHIRMNPKISVDKGHEISHKVSEKIKDEIEGVDDVTIHIEPEK